MASLAAHRGSEQTLHTLRKPKLDGEGIEYSRKWAVACDAIPSKGFPCRKGREGLRAKEKERERERARDQTEGEFSSTDRKHPSCGKLAFVTHVAPTLRRTLITADSLAFTRRLDELGPLWPLG